MRAYALCGLGGVGKTELAIEFMFRNKDKFDAVFWLPADDVFKLRDAFSQIAIDLGLERLADAKDQVVSTHLVKGWLANPLKVQSVTKPEECSDEASWLLIFDNVNSPEVLHESWPEFGHGSILITSRDPFVKTSVYDVTLGSTLPCFTDEEGAEFLLRLTDEGNRTKLDTAVDALAASRILGGLALGLVQMAGFINRKDYTFREFLEKYDEKYIGEMHKLGFGHRLITGIRSQVSGDWTV